MAEVQVQAQEKAQGFGDALKSAPVEAAPAAAPASEAAPAAAAAAPAEGVEAASAQPPKRDPAVSGVLKGIQAERSRRQAAEARTKELEAQVAELSGQQPTQAQPVQHQDPVLERRLLTISENAARRAHPDYEAKFSTFAKAAEGNLALYETVMQSDDPGEAAYQAGKSLQLQEKYGHDTDGMIKAIKSETETEMRAKIRAEVEAELAGKVADKNSQPTHITAGRAAGGGEAESVQPIGFAQVLARKPRG